jgi:acyl-coenzyme A thioesterase PaaI-like protein
VTVPSRPDEHRERSEHMAEPHLNQPGGSFLASTHPRVAGRERELRSMADAVRRLVEITVDSDADAVTTASAADRLHRLADELAAMVKEPHPPKHVGMTFVEESNPHEHFQLDVMLGLYNPLALPVEMSWEPPVARGRATFTSPYEGPPNCVHGAIISAAFDQVFNVANLKSGVAGPTAYLHVDYRRPTVLLRPLVFEGWVDRTEGRKSFCKGRLLQDEVVTCEAEGLFIKVSPEAIARLADM